MTQKRPAEGFLPLESKKMKLNDDMNKQYNTQKSVELPRLPAATNFISNTPSKSILPPQPPRLPAVSDSQPTPPPPPIFTRSSVANVIKSAREETQNPYLGGRKRTKKSHKKNKKTRKSKKHNHRRHSVKK
jgi:hypothetical protein